MTHKDKLIEMISDGLTEIDWGMDLTNPIANFQLTAFVQVVPPPGWGGGKEYEPNEVRVIIDMVDGELTFTDPLTFQTIPQDQIKLGHIRVCTVVLGNPWQTQH